MIDLMHPLIRQSNLACAMEHLQDPRPVPYHPELLPEALGLPSRLDTMSIHTIDPLSDRRWDDLVARHPNASAFHQRGWLEALARTYGYEPVVFTTSSPTAELKNGLVFCRVKSWLTGSRLVSLPFSDHCEPICDSTEEMKTLICGSQAALA